MKTVWKRKTEKRLLAGLLAFVMICGVAPNLPILQAAENRSVTVQDYAGGGAQDFANRWLLNLKFSEAIAEEANPSTGDGYYTGYTGLQVSIHDGQKEITVPTVEACAGDYGKGELAVILPYTYLPKYDVVNAGNYKVIIHASTITSNLATYEITEDFTMEWSQESGTWKKAEKSEAPENPGSGENGSKIQITTLGDYGAQDNFSRWLFRFPTTAEIKGNAWGTAYSGLQVVVNNGQNETVATDAQLYADENKGLGVIVPYTSLPKYMDLGSNTYTLTVKAGTLTSDAGTYTLTEDFTIEHTEGASFKVKDKEPVGGEPTITATVTVLSDERNTQGNTKDGFYFLVDPADTLPYDTQNWTISYEAKEGGIYVDDVLNANVKIKKVTESLYYVPLTEQGVTVAKNQKIKIDGVFGDNRQAVRYMPATFCYKGAGVWELEGSVEEETLTEQAYTVYDMYDLMQLSAIGVPEDAYFNLTALKESTNVGLKLHVNKTTATEDAQDYGIGFSKTVANNLWVPSGYQMKVNPKLGRIVLLTDVDTVVATTFLDDVKDAYDLELGVVNMDNQKGKLTARKFYVKVNGVEVLSYLDENLKRELGTYVPVYATKGMGLSFESCTKKGYKMVEKTPTIYDLSEVNGGIKDNKTKKTQCVWLGTTKKTTNMAVKMKVKWNSSFHTYNGTRNDEMKFGLAKGSVDTIWDAAASGWNIAIRPEQVIIATGDEKVLSSVGCAVPMKSFLLEIGTYDVEIQKNGKKVSDYGRMVYVKIDGKEVCTWLDQDLKRPLGNNLLVYTSESTSATLQSLTSTKYLIRKSNTIADLFDACGLSEMTLNKNNITKLGELPKKTGIALRTKVRYNKKSDEFKLAISKSVPDNFWDAEGSGWQFWFRPASNQIFIGYGVSEPAVVLGYDFQNRKNEFVLEVGERDVIYNTGKNYGREIYIKMDGEVILSWIDTDTSRKLGNYVTAWASQNSNIKFTSLTTKGYVPVDSVANVQDLFDVAQYASVDLTKNECINLGTVDNWKNQALKMKVNTTKETEEFKIAIGKVSDTTIWDVEESGWQFWFRPASNQIFIGYGMSEYAEVLGYEFPKQFTLEVGTRNVKMKNGKPYGLRIYIKIDGEEILSWVDQVENRKVGKNILAYASANADVTISTLYATKELPVEYKVNGKTKSSFGDMKTQTTVVVGKDSRIQVIAKKNPARSVVVNGIYQNQTELKKASEEKEVTSYLVKKPKATDQILVDISTKKLRVDSATILDFYEVSGVASYKVTAMKDGYVGTVVNGREPGGINTAMRMIVDTPEAGFNQIRLSYLGDSPNLWSTSGFIMNLTNQKALIQLASNQATLAEGNCQKIQPGKSLVVEVGAVKCYEEDLYKYDRWYVKVGESVEDLELAVWYDSTQRGGYGSSVASYGTDMEGSDFTLRSLKKIRTFTDTSAQKDKEKLLETERLGEVGYGAYYPKSVVDGEAASIKIYTKEGMALESLTVNGQRVKPRVSTDGAYIYEIAHVKENVKFSYTIKKGKE